MVNKKVLALFCFVQLIAVLVSMPCRAGVVKLLSLSQSVPRNIPQGQDVEHYSTKAAYLLAETAAREQVVNVKGVKIIQAHNGTYLVLSTEQSNKLKPVFSHNDKMLVADIDQAQLRLPSGNIFESNNPVKGIRQISVTQVGLNKIRVVVIGEFGIPQVHLFDSAEGLVLGMTPAAEQSPPLAQPTPPAQQQANQQQQTTPSSGEKQPLIERVVTTPTQRGYLVPNASVGTRTNTRIRDIPQSIQVVPRQIWEQQQAINTIDAVRNAGVIQAFNAPTNGDVFTIRGFQTSNILRDGLKDYSGGATAGQSQLADIERIEVLRGPASVLYGQGDPGGTINFVTKQPLRQPYFSASATFGSYGFYQPTLDISGPFNSDKTLLYRLNGSYINTKSFIDFFSSQRYLIAPALTWQIGKNTKLTFEGEVRDQQQTPRTGLPALGTVLRNPNGKIPLSRNIEEPNDINNRHSTVLSYNFEHRFSDNWSLVNAFKVRSSFYRTNGANPIALRPDGRTYTRQEQTYIGAPGVENEYALDNHVVGKFKTGSLQNELVTGFDLYRDISTFDRTQRALGPLDLFNPVYGQPIGRLISRTDQKTRNDQLGIYAQDIVKLANNFRLVLGGRGDFIENKVTNFLNAKANQRQTDSAFSPRVGLVYQPIQPVSLYTSFTQSLSQNIGNTFEGSAFQPSRGTQYEVGAKADFLSGRLSSTLALYQLTLSNVLTPDPNHPAFNIQTGEQRSRGIEFNVTGQILPGWNVIAFYDYTDARVTKDNQYAVGNRVVNVPENSASLWTTYTFDKGNLQGLGFGLGLFYVGERQGDLKNSFSVPSFLRIDAGIYYRRGHLSTALNLKNLSNVREFTPRTINLVYPGEPFTVEGTVRWEF